MAEYVNFYENIKEAEIRLFNTIVLYDNEPYLVIGIDNHKGDDIFRIYLDPLGDPNGLNIQRFGTVPYTTYTEPPNTRGVQLDDWMEKNPSNTILRKMMNSPLFNKFRPFPLGMCNYRGKVIYIERQPSRHTQQGLTANMLNHYFLSISEGATLNKYKTPDMYGLEMLDCIKGVYPTAEQCFENLTRPNIANEGAAFHRQFAFMRGPLDTLYLAYKYDIIGFIPNGDKSKVIIGSMFSQTKEVVENLRLFESIDIRS